MRGRSWFRGGLHILPDGLLDTREIGDYRVLQNVRLIYQVVWDSDRPICFDEIENAVQRCRNHEEAIGFGLQYLIENCFIAETQRNGILAYDLKHRTNTARTTANLQETG